MMRRHILSCVWGCSVWAATAAQSPQVFRAGVDVVSVNVSVFSGNRSVSGLSAGDFLLTDNGVPQEIEALSNDAVPLDVTLVVDVSSEAVIHQRIGEFQSDITRIKSLLTPADRFQLLADGTYVTEIVPMQVASESRPLGALPAGGGISTNDAVAFALMQPTPPDRRHLVVAFTEVLDVFSSVRHDELPAIAQRTDALLEVVFARTWTGGPGRGRSQLPATAQAFASAAQITGGDARSLDRGVVDAMKDVLNQFSDGYVLRYTPRGVTRSGWHELAVKITGARNEKLALRARRGYFAG